MDKGFLFNVKHLFLNPNKLVNEYIEGKRKNIHNPVSFLIIAVTIYLVADSLTLTEYDSTKSPSDVYTFAYEAGRFFREHFKYFWILSIFWLSISTRLIFSKYNYAEHLAINSFVIGQATLVGLIGFLIFKIGLPFNPLVYISIFWITYEVFKKRKIDSNIFIQSLGATFLFIIQLFIIVLIIGKIRSL